MSHFGSFLICCLCIAGVAFTAMSPAGADSPTVLYVATNGNDSWSGKLPKPNGKKTEGPFATLGKARDAVRALKVRGQIAGSRVEVGRGEYYLESALELSAADSGITIEAVKGEKPVLYGGCRITGWQREGDKLWSASLPTMHGQDLDFRHLVVNGHLCQRARLPETGAFSHLTEFKVPWMSTTGGGWQRQPTHEELTTMKYQPGDLGEGLDLKNAELTVFHVWDESMVGLAAHDVGTQTLRFSNPAGHPPGAFGVQKYVVWNIREGMRVPGQWYLDRTARKVVYWPLPGEDMRKAEVIAPAVESLIRIHGSKEAPVRNVTLKGLTFSVTNTPLKAGGFGASAFDGAASVQFATDCNLVNLTFRNVGGQGIKGHGCDRLRVENCEMGDIGACGIKVDGVDTVVSNNYVHHIGVAYPSAIAVWVDGQRAEVSHNEIHDTPYTAIAAGGTDHRIESNLIYRAMQVLHDGAGIYITFCKGIVVRGNYIHDIIDTGGYGASAYYLDEQAENCTVEDNLSVRINRPSHNHMAKNNTIRRNLFVVEGDAQLTFPRSTDFTLEKNVIYATGKIVLSNPAAVKTWANNMVFSGKGQVEGVPAEVVRGDPLFVNLTQGDFRFRPESSALALGLQPVDVSGAGRTGH